MEARFQDDKDQKPNIVQSQIIDLWLFRIYYLPLCFIYIDVQKIKELKEMLLEEVDLVSLNQFSSDKIQE